MNIVHSQKIDMCQKRKLTKTNKETKRKVNKIKEYEGNQERKKK